MFLVEKKVKNYKFGKNTKKKKKKKITSSSILFYQRSNYWVLSVT